MSDTKDRRPLAVRSTRWAKALATRLSKGSITPNQISQASILCAALAGLAFWGSGGADGRLRTALLLMAALFCQLRLICNLLDGMVAVEGGKSAPDGPYWNEAPDRFSDILIFAGVGLGIGHPALGFAAAALAVLTAYIRELGRAEGAANDFSGPMAKQHRMALITLAAIIAAFELHLWPEPHLLWLALWILLLGAALTAFNRSRHLLAHLTASK